MKTTLYVLAWVCFFAFIAGAYETATANGKGMELYSWKPEGKNWRFSLIVGVNNRKPVLEIADVKQYAVKDVAALKKKLSRLRKNEKVYWVNLSKEELPKEMEKDLRDFCRSIEVELKPVMQNKPAAGNAGFVSRLPIGDLLPGVPEPGRSVRTQ